MTTENNDEELTALAQETAEGVLDVLQILVISLANSGHLDTADFSRLLVDWRQDHTESESMRQAVVDRVLAMLVDEPEVLTRRLSMQLVQDESHDATKNPA